MWLNDYIAQTIVQAHLCSMATVTEIEKQIAVTKNQAEIRKLYAELFKAFDAARRETR